MSPTSDVHVTPFWEDADTERYHGQKALSGSVSLKEKHHLVSLNKYTVPPQLPQLLQLLCCCTRS